MFNMFIKILAILNASAGGLSGAAEKNKSLDGSIDISLGVSNCSNSSLFRTKKPIFLLSESAK